MLWVRGSLWLHLFISVSRQTSRHAVTWQKSTSSILQRSAQVQTKHPNADNGRLQWLWKWHGGWCQMAPLTLSQTANLRGFSHTGASGGKTEEEKTKLGEQQICKPTGRVMTDVRGELAHSFKLTQSHGCSNSHLMQPRCPVCHQIKAAEDLTVVTLVTSSNLAAQWIAVGSQLNHQKANFWWNTLVLSSDNLHIVFLFSRLR